MADEKKYESDNLKVVDRDSDFKIVRKRDGQVVLKCAGKRLCVYDFNGNLWTLTEILGLVCAHYPFRQEEIGDLAEVLTSLEPQSLRQALARVLNGTKGMPDNQRRAVKVMLGLIEDDIKLEARRATETGALAAFLKPFGASAEPELLTSGIAELHARYTSHVAHDLCGHDGNCLWWLPACSDGWRLWRQFGWSSPNKDKIRQLDPEDTQEGTWVLWTPVLQTGHPETILTKFRTALELDYSKVGMLRNATPSQLLYLLRRAERLFGSLPLGDDEALLTTAEQGWWRPEQVRIRRATTATVETAALDAALPGGDIPAYRMPAEGRQSAAPPVALPEMDPLELLLGPKAPAGYVEGIMPICFLKP